MRFPPECRFDPTAGVSVTAQTNIEIEFEAECGEWLPCGERISS